jgi:hypothetical protein
VGTATRKSVKIANMTTRNMPPCIGRVYSEYARCKSVTQSVCHMKRLSADSRRAASRPRHGSNFVVTLGSGSSSYATACIAGGGNSVGDEATPCGDTGKAPLSRSGVVCVSCAPLVSVARCDSSWNTEQSGCAGVWVCGCVGATRHEVLATWHELANWWNHIYKSGKR